MTTIDIKPGEIFDLPDGRFRFLEEWEDATLWFISNKKKRLPLTHDELVEMMGVGLAKRIDIFKRSDGRPKSVNDLGDFGPGEEWSDEAVRARTLQFYVREWDKTSGSLGRKGLQNFIKGLNSKVPDLLTHKVNPAALYNAIVNCGEPGNRPLRVFRSMRGKTGRRRFTKIVEEALDEAVDFYWSLRSRTYSDAYGNFRAKMKAAGIDPKLFPRRMETLRRRINRAINKENWARKYSNREATLKFEGIKDSLSATQPLELVIMDHTTVDAFVVFDNEHFLPLGRPTLTVAIDVATRMVLGYLISFEPASLYSVLTTLKRVNRSKSYMSRLFPDIEGTWEGWGLPSTILVDSAWEFKSPSLQDAMRDVGTEIIWSPVQTPQYKAVGERFFKTLTERLFRKVAGGVPAGPTEMRLIDVDPRKDAVISLGALDELMHEAIVGYHGEFHDGIQDVPDKVWERRAKTINVIDDITALDHMLGRKARVRLTRAGIAFKNMRFHDQAKTTKLLDDLSRRAKRRDQSKSPVGSARCWVDIKWDPIDASQIQVWNDGVKPPRYVTLPNRDRQFVMMPAGAHRQRDARSEFVRPISFWHAEQVRIFARETGMPYETEEQKWVARDKLRAKWERIAGLLPMRDHKDALRGLAQTQGQFDAPPRPADEPINASEVLFATADPSPSGMKAATLVPQQIAAFERDEEEQRAQGNVFEAVMAVASCFRPEVVGKTIAVGRPFRASDFNGFTPDLLEIAGRMIIGGETAFAVGTARLRAHMSKRKSAHGLFAEIGPLAATVVDPVLTPVVRAFLVESFQRDLRDTSELGLIRRRLGTVKPSTGSWMNMQEANEQFGLSKHALQRLAASGLVETRRSDAKLTPVLMNREDIAPLAARYKEAMDETRARAVLRLSEAELHELADRGIVERAEEAVTAMMDTKATYRASSVNAVIMAIKARAVPADPSRSIKDHLWKAVRKLPSPVPWQAIIELILSGDTKIELLREHGIEWRKCVAPIDVTAFDTLVRLEQAKRPTMQGACVTRSHAAHMLNIAESSVYKLAVSGFLPSKRDGRSTVYQRSDVEAAARKYIFLPEMLERSPFKVEHELGRWLKSVGIERLSEWTKSVFPIYDRASFERVFPSLPPALEDVEIEERASKRVPTDIRRKAVDEVKQGLTPYFVSRRFGVSTKTLTKWVAYYDEHGDVRPAGKLEGHEDYIRSAIEADPSMSVHAFWQDFRKNRAKVGYNILSKLIADLGYERDAAGRLSSSNGPKSKFSIRLNEAPSQKLESLLDEGLLETFPTSDPVAVSNPSTGVGVTRPR